MDRDGERMRGVVGHTGAIVWLAAAGLSLSGCTVRFVLEQPGQAAQVEAWQVQITERVNDISTCLPPETRACIDMQHPQKK